MDKKPKQRLGATQQKILLLLLGGLSLGLTRSPKQYFKIIEMIGKEWKAIDRSQLYRSIRDLYESKLVSLHERSDGVTEMVLSDGGKRRALEYNLDTIVIKKPKHWDGQWRFVMFDVPERQKKLRNALRDHFRQLGLLEYQKSVYIFPYNCKNEIDFIVEFYDGRRYVRYVLVKKFDNELHFREKFRLN